MEASMKKLSTLFLIMVIFLTGCQPSENTIQTAIVQTQDAMPTNTPRPTNTSMPTSTPRPTNTPRPTATFTPEPEPIVLSGTGDSVVDVEKWDSAAIARINNNGGGNFIVQNYNANGEQIELLVNTIGNYEGVVLLDILESQLTTRFEIKSSGQWEIEVLPLEQARSGDYPGIFEGNGDDVLLLFGTGKPDLLKVDASQAEANFIVFGFGSKRDLLVNEIAPYTGVVILPGNLPTTNGVLILAITATGNWSLEVTAK